MQDGREQMGCSNVPFVPIAADFQRRILETSTKEVREIDGDED